MRRNFYIDIAFFILLLSYYSSSVSGIQAAAFAYVTEFHCMERKNTAVSFVTMFLPGVFVFLPMLAWLIVPMPWTIWLYGLKLSPWRLYLISTTTLNVLTFLVVCMMPESPKFLLSMDRKEEAMQVLQRIYHINTRNRYDVCCLPASKLNECIIQCYSRYMQLRG